MNLTKQLQFSSQEFGARVRAVREAMQERNIDVLLIDQTEFLHYITGFSVSENMYRACLLPLEGEPVMVLRAVDLGPFTEGSWLTQAVPFADWEDPITVLARTINDRGWAQVSLGLDEDSYCMPLRRFRQLQTALPKVKFVDFSGVLECLRMRKSPQEISYMRKASKIADLAMEEILANACEGYSARAAAADAHKAFMAHGADTSRAGIITSGVGESFLHGNLHDYPMKQGDVLHLELLPLVNGYSARLMRPIVIGQPNEKAVIARALIDAQDKQFAAMKPGAKASDIDAIVRNELLETGVRKNYFNITGYTIGYFPLSTPHTSDFSRIFLPTSDWLLEPGMTFHMYVAASGLAFSETVLVTNDGIELLTNTPRRLFVA